RLTSLVDVFPTLLAAAGTELPGPVDGRPLDATGHEYVFAEGEGFLTVTDGRYKLLVAQRDDTTYTELFDLETDPAEFVDVAGRPEYAAVQRDLQAAALEALLATTLP